ncbi:alpha/beta fold hydrolase [Caulobacter sp. UNC358MFTsu5.1]|uniref:alpha/beta fold hydrolase n=1 Tax=Caulobacter sp. UNC358MFTsu5.1 TaxID=1449049 RepID=UPI0012DDFADD|nr:alpha/beta hydrolase [Caulobacter sp. UNC358MFTsu5.1]
MLVEALLALSVASAPGAGSATSPRSPEVCAAEGAARAGARDAELAYRDLGPAAGRPVLLLTGTDQQMTQWPQALLAALQARGFRPIVYDARDVGCSTHHGEAGPANWPAIFTALAAGERPALPYTLETLAQDAIAVLDHLGVPSADLVGASAGATVAGEVAASRPERVGRLVLLMANSGNPALPLPADPARLAAIPPPPPMGADADAVAAYRVAAWRALDGSETLAAPETYPALAAAATARSWDADAIGRGGAALLAAGDRRPRLAAVRAPTVVIHGDADPLVSTAAGREVADAIPGARFVAISGMGHSLTPASLQALLQGLTGSPAGNGHD